MKIIKEVFNSLVMDDEAKKALLSNNMWVNPIIMQIKHRLPNENIDSHLKNIAINIANYSNNNYPYPGYYDIIERPNKVCIIIATTYINYVCRKRYFNSKRNTL